MYEPVIGPDAVDCKAGVQEEQAKLTRKIHVAVEIAQVTVVGVALETVIEEANRRALLDEVERRGL